jgi:hypothetical protein
MPRRHLELVSPKSAPESRQSKLFDRSLSALVALSLALLGWLYLRSRDQEMLDNVPIPVQVGLAPGQEDHYELEVSGPCQVPVSFLGPPSRIRELRGMLQRGEVRVEVTLAVPEDRQDESRYADTIRVEAGDVHAPPGVRALIIEGRNRIPVMLHRLVEKRLPVRFEHAAEDRITRAVVEPATVLVRGPQEVLEHARAIATQVCPLAPRTEGPSVREEVVTLTAALVPELDGRPVRTTPAAVAVHVTLKPQQKVYELTDVPVQFLCPPNFGLRPLFGDERAGKITLRLRGPAGEEPPAVVAYIDLGGRKWEPGLYEEAVRLQIAKDYQLAQGPPRRVAFQLVANDPAPKAPEGPRAP